MYATQMEVFVYLNKAYTPLPPRRYFHNPSPLFDTVPCHLSALNCHICTFVVYIYDFTSVNSCFNQKINENHE